jgi:hypothetical protein
MVEGDRAQRTNGQGAPDGEGTAESRQQGQRPTPLEQQFKEAELRQKIAEAEQKAEEARRLRIKSMTPDISTVPPSELKEATGERGIGSSALTFGALDRAAEKIAAHIARVNPRPDRWRVLVTSDQDLASPDVYYHEVTSGLEQLAQAADTLLSLTAPLPPETATTDVQPESYGLPIPALLTAVVPQVLSLLSAQRSLISGAITTTDLAAATAVAGALETELSNRVNVLHDEFRLVYPGRVQAADTLVAQKRQELVSRKILLTSMKAVADAGLASAMDEKEAADTALADAGTSPDPKLVEEVARTRELVKQHTIASSDAGVKISMVEALITTIDAFAEAIRKVPESGRRSPLAAAALHDQLHEGAGTPFTHVLLVKAQPAQFSQLTNDKPLWFADNVSTLVEVNVTYMLIATTDSSIVRAGTASATAMAYGKLGEIFKFDNSRVYLSSVPEQDGDTRDGKRW